MSARIHALVCLLIGLSLTLTVSVVRQGALSVGPDGRAVATTGVKIDPNTADAATLRLLPGIGAGIAERIVQTREAGQVFLSALDLTSVKFIGPSVVARVRPWVRFDAAVQPQDKQR